jgi:nitrate reductase molybdenum cofactor assembly chaperone
VKSTTNESRVLGLFAELLEYPRPGVAQTARECRALIAPESEEAAALLGEFAAFAERTPHATLEEVFTSTFDLNASCHPYVGYHMFGEAYKRSALMLELQNRFREHNFDPGVELPDHIAVLLRFMSLCPDAELTNEIAREALLPTLEPMTAPPDPEEDGDGEDQIARGFGESPRPEDVPRVPLRETVPVGRDPGQEALAVFHAGDDYRRVLHALRLILQARYGMPVQVQPIPVPDQALLIS